MDFLTFDEHTRKIIVSPEAEDLVVVKILRDKDSTEDKRFYNNALSYVYHVYKKDHFFHNLSINERKTRACELYMHLNDYKKYENNSRVKDLIKLYISLEYSQNEWTYQTIKNDINDMRQSINLIPLTKVIKFEQKVDVDVPSGEEGKTIMRTVLVKKDVVVDNTKERMGALDRLLDLEEKEEKFRAIIEREKKVKQHDGGLSLLEQNFFEEK